MLDRERVIVRISGLVEIETARANQPVPATGEADAEQRQRDRPATRNPVQQARQPGSRQSGEQRSDPMPGRKEGRTSKGFERSPFMLESGRRRQRLTVELYLANHVGALLARDTVSA